ncbi:MAG: acetyl-CoA hydrolase [Acidimicrobiia bacterium]|nr:acetyl-CoA hydrolase [Acidimicrobiia bacterium]
MPSLESVVRAGDLVAVADGCGAPLGMGPALTRTAHARPGTRLLLGWCPAPVDGLCFEAFTDVRTVMGGYGLRTAIDSGRVRYVPARLGAVPALLAGPLRPDVLVVAARRDGRRYFLGSEVGWARAAIEVGARVALVLNDALPVSDADGPLSVGDAAVVAEQSRPPVARSSVGASPVFGRIGAHVASLIPEGARLQHGPGPLGDAIATALEVPVRVDSGLVTDAVVDLDSRGLLVGEATAAYLSGTERLYRWADGRPVLHRVEHTHDLGRLAAGPHPLVAVNAALEIDLTGQVNVERSAGSIVGGVGGHSDYAAAAARCPGGSSIVALPSSHDGHSTLVERIEGPITTPRHDVDVVVTERGWVDLRGLDDVERGAALLDHWGGDLRRPGAARQDDRPGRAAGGE